MLRELSSEEVIYSLNFENKCKDESEDNIYNYQNVYEKIKLSLDINKQGYNLYLIDEFSREKLEKILEFCNNNLQEKNPPKDVCYVVSDDDKCPYPIYVENGKGKEVKETLENLQDNYSESIYEFYSNYSNEEKDNIMDELSKKRNELVNDLMDKSKEEGFEIKAGHSGFVFMPIKDEKVLTEDEYDNLDALDKEEILEKVSSLKSQAKKIIQYLKDLEEKYIEKLKKILKKYLDEEMNDQKQSYKSKFENSLEAIDFLNTVCRSIEDELIEGYTMEYEDDMDDINDMINKYKVNVLLDNSGIKHPYAIFEEDPNLVNLIGSIEYENRNGVYATDINMIKAGSILKANNGCTIIRINDLLTNTYAYYYLKKILLREKVDFDYNKGYLELLSLSGLKPEPIKFNPKVILIGDYETYNLLYNYDEDFKKIFKLKVEFNPVVDITNFMYGFLFSNIQNICKKEDLKQVTKDAVLELAKILSKKSGDRNKIYFNDYDLDTVLIQANNIACKNKKEKITREEIEKVYLEKDYVEEEVLKEYKDKIVFIDIDGEKVGQINGLSVIDIGHCSFGRPIRITCSSYKGSGEIIDIQKAGDLSGSIHDKAIGILKGYINTLIDKYETLPVDFHLSFEQVYGKVDGDSASVAEVISIISSLSKIGVKQNLAVTGSINQFGEVQPIGGVNEKIEGFFNVCKTINTFKGKGVVIPRSNKNNLILNKEVEEAISKGEFHIYTIETIEDATKILLGQDYVDFKTTVAIMDKEIKKYCKKYKGRLR